MILATQHRFIAEQITWRQRWLREGLGHGHSTACLERYRYELEAFTAVLESLEHLQPEQRDLFVIPQQEAP